ncbi:allantoicase [Wolfiporia cocos MD-104 SS10]|uniref:Allantoicase n=1 Tax=Wolfiporia cocos (strain MD-104) TaxID=742152 RepID=A0A2H3JPI2_WOLCO|nr:allantoicase [Wolfiporia cocos MD-104 SS10]
MSYERIPLEQFPGTFSTAIELSSVALGGSVISFSDEFFAEAFHLLLVEPPPSLKGQFGPKGALYSGWETRRHNPAYDWCIIKLGTTGSIYGFDVDTTHFNGNEAPEVSIQALYRADPDSPPQENDAEWSEILPKVSLGPSSRHLFKIPPTDKINYVKLNMYPDGGIARFRVYGLVAPVFPADVSTAFDLAHVFAGGRVVFTSDQHFGVGSNLILPGRGKDMGDGWETKRSRQKGHKDWAIIKLGDAGILSHAEIDTAHFKGNFPESCELHAVACDDLIPSNTPDSEWKLILPRTKLGPHRQHHFQLQNVQGVPYTHVRITIYPDGGIKRVRLIGHRARGDAARDAEPEPTVTVPAASDDAVSSPSAPLRAERARAGVVIPALPLTPEAFALFGQVVQAYEDMNAVPSPRTTRVTGANQGTATKFHKLALLESSYPADARATTGLSVYRCKPVDVADKWEVKLLERHPYTNQAFIPMGAGQELEDPGKTYLVIVALNGGNDRPNLQSMRAFVATAGQGIMYNTGVWHHPMTVLNKAMDFTCVETQIGDGSDLDCEIVTLDDWNNLYTVQLP